jgi:hypothetical protein
LNEAKSKFSAGAPINKMAVYEGAGDSVKVTLDGTGADGKPSHTEWTGKFDGKDYPISGTAAGTRSYTKVDAYTMKFVVKNGSNLSLTGRIVISSDGKTRTVTAKGNDEGGKKIKFTAVYDKQ